jgi:hypothetical protein
MTAKKYAIWCANDPERCAGDAIFLGYASLGESLRCPRCGRNTAAGKYSWKLSTWNNRNKAGGGKHGA